MKPVDKVPVVGERWAGAYRVGCGGVQREGGQVKVQLELGGHGPRGQRLYP
jgi:hypothetical protein